MDQLSLQLLEQSPEGRGRMATALLVSLALHGLLLAWQGSRAPDAPAATPALEVTLVNSRSPSAPLTAQALAQQSLAGGGPDERGLAASPLPKTMDSGADEIVLQALRQRQAQLEAEQQRLLTRLQARQKVPAAHPAPQIEGSGTQAGEDQQDQDSALLNARIAALKDRIERYNAQPRSTFVGPATQAVDYAQYVEAWRQRIELIGTEHYPQQARGKIYGELQLTVYIRRDGTLDHIVFDRPSSEAILNSAARRIIELAAPFDPLPAALARHTDILAITRTWRFTRAGLDTDAP